VDRIAIFAALQWECRPVLRQLGRPGCEDADGFRRWHADLPHGRVVLVRTGIGLERAEAAARALAAGGEFDLFLSTGCAGGLAPELRPGDLVVARSIGLAGEPAERVADAARARARAAAERASLRLLEGHVLSSPRILAGAEEKRAAAAAGAKAVEMEGAAVARVAGERGIPFASVRSILDGADTRLEHSGVFVDPATGALRPWAIARHLARRPGTLRTLLEMRRMMEAAEDSLTRFFAAFLECEDGTS
jgi:adenosylhomocysteine nucleosidase